MYKLLLLFILIICSNICIAQDYQQKDYEISHDFVSWIVFKRNSTEELTITGQSQLDGIGTEISDSTNASLIDKYIFVFEVYVSMYEKTNNPNIGYERVKYVLDYLEEKFNIKRERFYIRFFSTERSTSYLNFVGYSLADANLQPVTSN
jgi:endonuclease III-like uncharacterized protein